MPVETAPRLPAGGGSTPGRLPRWERWNFRLLAVFGPVLIVTGVVGFIVPAELSLMSGAAPYNIMHLVAGTLGLGLVLAHRARAVCAFNVIFGAFDLYQAVAGATGIFPAGLFALRPADHLVHVVLGLLLVGVGVRGLGLSSMKRETT